MKMYRFFLVTALVIVIDQVVKLWVYYNYSSWPFNLYGDHELKVFGEWFKLHYLLNPGMAFGIRWESEFGKLALTLFRIAAMGGIGYYLIRSFKALAHPGFLVCLALILGGAIGNVIDSTFYGVFLDNAPLDAPTKWFHGQVIDMLYFPLFEFYMPQWIPWLGGKHFLFFSPVFNIADSSIFLGVVSILIFQKKFFPEKKTEEPVRASEATLTETPDALPPEETSPTETLPLKDGSNAS